MSGKEDMKYDDELVGGLDIPDTELIEDEEDDDSPEVQDGLSHTVRSKDFHVDQRTVTIDHYARSLAIKIHCTECMGFESNPSVCTSKMCALYPFRKRTRRAY